VDPSKKPIIKESMIIHLKAFSADCSHYME